MTRSYNLAKRLFIDSDGTPCEITNIFDADGEETGEPEEARAIVVKRSATDWFTAFVNEEGDAPAASS